MESKTKRPYSRMPNSNPRLLLGGTAFEDTVEDLQVAHVAIDRVAQAMESAEPDRYPKGTGRAREVLVRRLRVEFGNGVNLAALNTWLSVQV